MKKLVFTVTNDLTCDQRMIRICTSLAENGFDVTLIGTSNKHSSLLPQRPFSQQRIYCFFKKGKLFYTEYNLKLFFRLLRKKADAICAIDLDTILPVLFASRLKKIKRVYDAHELFTEMKEVVTRPHIHAFWKKVESVAVPKFANGYTVSDSIVKEFNNRYKVKYDLVRNVPVLYPALQVEKNKDVILYQGAVNEARGLEYLIPAMEKVNAQLWIYGDGNFMQQCKTIAQKDSLRDKVIFKGVALPENLKEITAGAYIGINLVEPIGLNQIYSLANKFFDYIHAGVPQLTMNFPEYTAINNQLEVAVLIDTLNVELIAEKLNLLLSDSVLYSKLEQNCKDAAQFFNWHEEEKKIISFYKTLLG